MVSCQYDRPDTGRTCHGGFVVAKEQEILIEELKLELMKQWLANHYEHCGQPVPWLPHEGRCEWPIPGVLVEALPENALHLLLLEASGESFGLRPRSSEC